MEHLVDTSLATYRQSAVTEYAVYHATQFDRFAICGHWPITLGYANLLCAAEE